MTTNTADKKFTVPKPGKSALGQQVLSAKKTFPSYAFGRATRDKINDHGYLSEEHARRVGGECAKNPAAKYEPASSLGKQALKQRRNAPAFSVGRSKRFMDVPNYTPLQTPGPGSYE